MVKIGITGHTNLAHDSQVIVSTAINAALASYNSNEVTGISCLAPGADSIFATAVLDFGGKLEVVLPSADYAERKIRPEDRPRFEGLLRRASHVEILPYERSNRQSYEAANEVMLESSNILFAIWDGEPAVDKGGTAHVVESAQLRGLPVTVLWPDGARRT